MSEMKTALKDTFVLDNMPDASDCPEITFDLPELEYPSMLNAAEILLKNDPDRVAVLTTEGNWSYGELARKVNQIAHVLVDDMGLVSGNRVLLRAPNTAMMAACWLAVLKAGGVAVSTMPLLRAKELAKVIDKAQVTHALCEAGMLEELHLAREKTKTLGAVLTFGKGGDLEGKMTTKPSDFKAVDTYANDPALLAFTSGTTGKPKACIHGHCDILTMANTFSRNILQAGRNEIFAGTPPLSFTFGLGGLLVFPFAVGAATVLDGTHGIEGLAKDIDRFGVTTLFTSPTAYRALLTIADNYDFSSLKKCVSAGETLSRATSDAWLEKTGIRLIDGIGSTEMIHIFISASGDDIRPGATGKPIPGFKACILGEDDKPLKIGVGRLAVKGPLGCRYLDDPRQKEYVIGGWNVTGDIYKVDEEGYFWFQARSDDMIVSSGYNIAGPDVENALLSHDAVFECAVVGIADEKRGQIIKAFVVLNERAKPGPEIVQELQDYVKATIAPYKYPRAIDFLNKLPKTETGKIQRFKLRAKDFGGRSK